MAHLTALSPGRTRQIAKRLLAALALWLVLACPAAAQEEAEGYLIRLPLPIKGEVDSDVIAAVDRLLERLPEEFEDRPALILEFPADDEEDGSGSQFERCLALANHLTDRKLNRLRTVAYISGRLKGHAVLVAMACEQIIVRRDGGFGEAGVSLQNQGAVSEPVREAYRTIAKARGSIPEAVALGMVDPSLTVYKLETGQGTKFVTSAGLAELEKQKLSIDRRDTLIREGELGFFAAGEARASGLIGRLVRDRQELAEALQLPASAIRENPSLLSGWKAVQVDITGAIQAGRLAASVNSRIEKKIAEEFNLIIFRIDSAGGDLQESIELAKYIADLDPGVVRTVAYVPSKARGDAALIALACDDLIMQPNAVLGGSGAFEPTEEQVQDGVLALKDIAKQKARNWSPMAAMLDDSLSIFRYKLKGSDTVDYFSPEELQEMPRPQDWEKGIEVKVAKAPWKLTGAEAKKIDVARATVPSYEGLKSQYNLKQDPVMATPSVVDRVIEWLAGPTVSMFLLFIAGFALMMELFSPGIGIGGFVAAVSFTLFFWSQFLEGHATWLEILLFIVGIICVVMEIFVLPGTGVFGIGGGLLVIISIVLASQTFIQVPRNEYQFNQMLASLLTVVAGGLGVVTSLFVARRLLHRAPVFRNVMLAPPEGAEAEELSRREAMADYQHLLGQQGEAATRLAPSGKALIGEELVDVVSDGEMLARGDRLQVVAVQGNRVIVQSLDSGSRSG